MSPDRYSKGAGSQNLRTAQVLMQLGARSRPHRGIAGPIYTDDHAED